MADYSDPKRATAYRFTLSLFARSDNQVKVTPTLAAGDVKVSKDNGATANITTLPAETPASSGILQVDLSATEMTADLVTIIFRDAAGAEWNDAAVHLAPGVRQMADLAYPATSGRSMVVDAAGLVDANVVKLGPTGSGTAQTARDVGGQLDAAISTRLATASYTSPLSSAGTRSALGLASANLDTQIATLATAANLATVDGIVDAILLDTAEIGTAGAGLTALASQTSVNDLPTNAELATALGTADDATLAAIAALSIPSAAANAAAVLAAAFEGAETVQDFLRLSRAALYGKVSGLATTTAVFRDKADTKDRITATVDADGNRSALTIDAA